MHSITTLILNLETCKYIINTKHPESLHFIELVNYEFAHEADTSTYNTKQALVCETVTHVNITKIDEQ